MWLPHARPHSPPSPRLRGSNWPGAVGRGAFCGFRWIILLQQDEIEALLSIVAETSPQPSSAFDSFVLPPQSFRSKPLFIPPPLFWSYDEDDVVSFV